MAANPAPRSRARWLVPASIALVWFAAPFVLAAVVSRNAGAGLYGTTDAIVLPITYAVALCLAGIPYFGFFAVAALRRFAPAARPWAFRSTLRQWIVLVLFVAGALVLASELVYWWSPGHAPILFMYGAALAWLVWVRPMAAADRAVAPTREPS